MPLNGIYQIYSFIQKVMEELLPPQSNKEKLQIQADTLNHKQLYNQILNSKSSEPYTRCFDTHYSIHREEYNRVTQLGLKAQETKNQPKMKQPENISSSHNKTKRNLDINKNYKTNQSSKLQNKTHSIMNSGYLDILNQAIQNYSTPKVIRNSFDFNEPPKKLKDRQVNNTQEYPYNCVGSLVTYFEGSVAIETTATLLSENCILATCSGLVHYSLSKKQNKKQYSLSRISKLYFVLPCQQVYEVEIPNDQQNEHLSNSIKNFQELYLNYKTKKKIQVYNFVKFVQRYNQNQWIILKLKQSIKRGPFMKVKVFSQEPFQQMSILVCHRSTNQQEQTGQIRPGFTIVEKIINYDQQSTSQICYQNSLRDGDAGAPMIVRQKVDGQDEIFIIGMHSGATQSGKRYIFSQQGISQLSVMLKKYGFILRKNDMIQNQRCKISIEAQLLSMSVQQIMPSIFIPQELESAGFLLKGNKVIVSQRTKADTLILKFNPAYFRQQQTNFHSLMAQAQQRTLQTSKNPIWPINPLGIQNLRLQQQYLKPLYPSKLINPEELPGEISVCLGLKKGSYSNQKAKLQQQQTGLIFKVSLHRQKQSVLRIFNEQLNGSNQEYQISGENQIKVSGESWSFNFMALLAKYDTNDYNLLIYQQKEKEVRSYPLSIKGSQNLQMFIYIAQQSFPNSFIQFCEPSKTSIQQSQALSSLKKFHMDLAMKAETKQSQSSKDG